MTSAEYDYPRNSEDEDLAVDRDRIEALTAGLRSAEADLKMMIMMRDDARVGRDICLDRVKALDTRVKALEDGLRRLLDGLRSESVSEQFEARALARALLEGD